MIFCACKCVSLSQIEQRFKECGSMQQTLVDLQVGTNCGTCLTRLDLLKPIEDNVTDGAYSSMVRAGDSFGG